MRVKLGDVCERGSSSLKQSNVEGKTGDYPIFGAAGQIGYVDFYHQEGPYVAVVKDGAGIGRTSLLPARSSVIGTMQYLLPKENVLPEYLCYVVQHMHLEKYFSGATIPHIYFRDYQNEEFELVGPAKQAEIVDILKRVERIICLRQRQLRALDTLIKARFIEMFGDPVFNSMCWQTRPLEEVCKTIVDCPHSTPNYTSEDTGYMCIRTSIVKKNHIMWDEIEYIPKDEFIQRIQRKKPEKGDIIYTREGAILGIAAVIDRDCNVALGQRSMLLSPDTKVCTAEFLSVAMNFDSFLNNALKGMSGSASPHINVGDIKAFQMILPPIEQQRAFSLFVQRVDKSKLSIQQSLEKLETLKQSLMQQYLG